MTAEPKSLKALLAPQAQAADPAVHAWVSASAGTGKTQVLAARVLRLLLQGVPAPAILCITFTKLAAAEMQSRVMERLAWWTRASDDVLTAELAAIGAPTDLAHCTRARRLFAQLLDAPQGLAVQTIHALAQSLISAFPIEAGVAPGFQTLDDRAGQTLRRRLLAEAIESATNAADDEFLNDLARLSVAGGEASLTSLTALIGRHAEALATLPATGLEAMLRRAFGLRTDADGPSALKAAMEQFDHAAFKTLADAWEAAAAARPQQFATRARAFLKDPDCFAKLATCFLKEDLTPYKSSYMNTAPLRAVFAAAEESFAALAEEVAAIAAEQALHEAVARVAAQLRVARRLSRLWLEAKARMGVVDYDDMIAAARRLLAADGAAGWVRYKLDQRIDHVLVDEAQDTNAAQWEIIRALTEEFFSGVGAREAMRRLFVVGDYKQAIFGFQGSDPRIYRDKREDFAGLAEDAGTPLQSIPLSTNFRSLPTILQLVDQVAADLPETALDADGVPKHVAHRKGAGEVLMLPLTLPETPEDSEDEDESEAPSEGDRPGAVEIEHARRLAARIAGWLSPATPLRLPARGTVLRPQDILVLVRQRTAFSAALVAALHAHGVPVAGVDRLKLSEPLAVADLLALARFALQPADDLTLAALLVSPLLGLNHEALFSLAHQRPGTLWEAVRASEDADVTAARDWLTDLLSFADFTPPYEFFERVLSGPLQGRKKLLARLGAEARDAIDTVLDQALAYEAGQPPSLQGFLAWIEADDVEIKRDPDAPLAAVRLMTVHGAKGLQAPVVILADTARPPRKPDAALLYPFDDGTPLPISPGPAKSLTGTLAEALDDQQADAMKEHWRLLYVALTRAEDLLVIAGSLPAKNKTGEADPASWYAVTQSALTTLGAVFEPDGALSLRSGEAEPAQVEELKPESSQIPIPDWLHSPAPPESRPSRPLSPSALAEDTLTAPPAGPAAAAAARRGVALHALFERLPAVPPAQRQPLGMQLARHLAPDDPPQPLVDEVLRVLDDPAFAAVFAPDALAEAPIAAVVGETVIAGQVDRLCITDTKVTLVDFKTGRRVPADAASAPPYHLAQMAAYAAALAQIFPTHCIEAALLYTAGPRLLPIPPELLARHAPQLNQKPIALI